MKKLRKHQGGMSLVELLLLLFLILILILLGWYVWSKNNSSSQGSDQQTSSPAKAVKKAEAPDPTSDWVKYSNAPGKFNLKHPKTWVEFSSPQACNEGLFLVGADANSVGKCATESFGQMAVASTDGDTRAESKLSTGYKDVVESKVTINGVTGTKQTGTADGQQNNDVGFGYADGTKVIKYVFFTNNRTYTAAYIQSSTYPDALSDFNLMITKTLKFEA